MLYNLIATAAPAANPKAATAIGGFAMLIPIIMIGLMVVWETVQRKKIAKKSNEMMNGLKEGDKVVTIGGLVGEIASVHDDTVDVKVDKGIRLQFKKKAIAQVIK